MAACTLPLREALNHSISSGRLSDTKIILYSRRTTSGTISKPKALYANSHVLKSVPYFSHLLSGEYAESEPKDFSEPIDDDEEAKNYDYYSDSDLEDDEDTVNAGKTPKKAIPRKSSSLDPLRLPANDKKSALVHGEWKETSGKGMIIKVHDVAFITFQAFLMYLYTDRIEFAPYGSEENRRSRSVEIVSSSEDSIPRPSPKSIYRLADKYDIPILKRLALGNIRSGLERCDIVEEAFNKFSSNYGDVRVMLANHLASILSGANEDSAKDLCYKFDEKIESYANGDLDHALDTITLLWELAKAGGLPPPAPPDEMPHTEPTSSPANWKNVEIALIKSIRKGIFFDRKYWTRKSKAGGVLRPVYMSSIVAGEHLRSINGLVKMHREGKCPDRGEGSGDSDYESSSEEASGSKPEVQDEKKDETEPESLPVLTTGSFSSWRSLFFYLCTDIIRFAPLKSQGVDVRARYVQKETMAGELPPCSPKVIHSLATALEIKALRELAFTDIWSKLTAANVVNELFSSFASQQGDIAKRQCELLYDKFNDDTTTAKGVELIESMLGGNSPHRAGALKLGLREGFLGGVLLRCPRSDCDLHHNSTPHRLLESSVRCPRGHKSSYLACVACGTSRTDSSYTSCEGCKKRFR